MMNETKLDLYILREQVATKRESRDHYRCTKICNYLNAKPILEQVDEAT